MRHLLIICFSIILVTGCATNEPQQEIPRVNEYELGKAAYEKGDYSHAAQYQSQWLVKYPKDANAYLERGRAHDKMNDYEAAGQDFEKASALAPGSLRSRVYQCGVLVSSGRQEEARTLLEDIFSHSGFSRLGAYERFLTHLLDGQLKSQAEEAEPALKSLNKALELYDSHQGTFAKQGAKYVNRLAYYHRAVVHNSLASYPEAAADMQLYIELSKKANQKVTSKDYMSLAYALYMCQEYDQCKAVLAQVSPQDRQQLAQILNEDMFK